MEDEILKSEKKILGFTKAEWDRRHQKIRELMQLRDIDCLIITGNTGEYGGSMCNLLYVSGMSDQIKYVLFPLEGEPIQLALSGGGEKEKNSSFPISFTQSVRYKKNKGEGKRIRDWSQGIVNGIRECGLEKAFIGIVDMRVMPAGIYMDIRNQLPKAEFIPAGDILLEARRVKSAEEHEYIKVAARCADEGAKAMMESASQPGVTQKDLQTAARIAMLKAGAKWVDFAAVRVASWAEIESSTKRPGHPDRRLKKGDFIINELAPGVEGGYFVQACYPILLGSPNLPDSFNDIFKLHQDIYHMACEELRPGTSVIDIERKVLKIASSRGNFERAWALQASEIEEAFYKNTYSELKKGVCYVIHPWTEPQRGKPGFRGHFLGNTLIVSEEQPVLTSQFPIKLHIVSF